ncbi:senescence-associated protein AAF, chlorolplastic-like [Cryptomeria japonica]|uniref:senescence-associated protein AAF, chlorolplastic-like n=1 Tax=Cryptomeria japonica TaxID=3369 RepID=UPI0025AC4833|nr:senescence-associated protein AAF, chlorolplastic-like [Cryptomeria japonica]
MIFVMQFVKNVHDMMVRTMYQVPGNAKFQGENSLVEGLTIEKKGKTFKIFPGKVSDDQITAIQDAYWSMASALEEADGIDYTNPDELELLVATLLDMDAIDGKSSATLLAECSSSPDVGTRQALANALADAPSMWTLGNAGMGALQRLARDSNPAVGAAASKAIEELRRQWQIEEGDTLLFSMDERYLNTEIDKESDKC